MIVSAFIAASLVGATAPAGEPPAAELDLAAFASGALIQHVSSEYGAGWKAIQLIDEDPSTGWCSQKGAKGPLEIELSLPERSEIHAVELDAAQVERPEYAPKEVDVLVSDVSAGAGFQKVAHLTLTGAVRARFEIAKGAVGRWLKLEIASNHGAKDYTELMGVRAFGRQLTSTPLPNVSGTWSSEHYGLFHLEQNGAQLSGCYEYERGLFQGGLEAHLMRITWTQGKKGEQHGPALLVLEPDGRHFRGLWRSDDAGKWEGDWNLTRVSEKVGTCPHWNPESASGNVIGTALATSGRARLYGIHFESDSDRLGDESRPALEEVVSALKSNAGWKITIEGHTDSTSTPEHNVALSRRRADAVKAYLVAAGISAERMSTRGFGQSKPVASNDTASGRAQNRRVEIVRQ